MQLLTIPSLTFLDQVEALFDVCYPESFRSLCRRFGGQQLSCDPPHKGSFIADLETLYAVNARIGSEQWGDYEQGILGQRYPKDGTKVWGELLPIFLGEDVDAYGFRLYYGFGYPTDGSDRVLVWNIHTLVHDYPSLPEWLKPRIA